MPFNEYNEKKLHIIFIEKLYGRMTAGCSNFGPAFWASVAMMPWLWGGAAKEKYSHEDLYHIPIYLVAS